MTDTPRTPSPLSREQLEGAVAFHGHSCPGLAIGLRAAEVALHEVGHDTDEAVLAVVETDMCGVDGIQFITGCTFGKGNLIHRDWGKMAFTFFRRRDGKGIRIRYRPRGLEDDADAQGTALRDKRLRGEPLTAPEQARLSALRDRQIDRILSAPIEDLFEIQAAEGPIPSRANRLASIACEACGEPTMESRIRRFDGAYLCIPCFEENGVR